MRAAPRAPPHARPARRARAQAARGHQRQRLARGERIHRRACIALAPPVALAAPLPAQSLLP
eukprot:2793865-Prymnesium_polylepis.1